MRAARIQLKDTYAHSEFVVFENFIYINTELKSKSKHFDLCFCCSCSIKKAEFCYK